MEGDYSGREKEKPLQKAETNPNPNLTLTLNAYKKVLAERVTHFFQFWLFIVFRQDGVRLTYEHAYELVNVLDNTKAILQSYIQQMEVQVRRYVVLFLLANHTIHSQS